MARNNKKLTRGNKNSKSIKSYIDFNTYVIDLIASEYGWTDKYIENLKFSKGLKLMLAIRERNKLKMVKQIKVLGTVLLDGEVKTEIINDLLQEEERLEEIEKTDFEAIQRLKVEMK